MYIARIIISILLCSTFTNIGLPSLSLAEEATLENEVKSLKEVIEKLENRLKHLEPSNPINIKDPPWEERKLPANEAPISEVIKTGTKIPFKIIVNKPKYERPAYEEHWHSSVGRWSYLPIRVHYAKHRLFTNYDIGISGWYDFEHNLGISVPMFQNEKALDMYIVTFQTQVTNVYTKGNQVVVVGNPNRKGVQVITITTKDINHNNGDDTILVQLATQDGYEMDYSLISYVQPNFWAQQKRN
ncbi:hypothetical protein ACOI1C_12675 [Bacillus sp. DJP31]|uniref:hypothetical protein n=1 Tax=Bacillus sp. DJP31 TaxID=3409789 RepID=UPI003BB6EB14